MQIADLSSIVISPMTEEDADGVAKLSGQLGYAATTEIVTAGFRELRQRAEHEILVARVLSDMSVVGWIQFGRHVSLGTGPRLELYGLVVDENVRGKGIGRRLIGAAETWARERGLKRVSFYSRATRADAHRLYERLGYAITKTSHAFKKDLS